VIRCSRRRLAILTVAAVVACTDHRVQNPESPEGTYSLQICRVRCASPEDANTLATGHLVLLDSAVDTAALRQQDSAGRILADLFIFEYSEAPPNGCFVWRERRSQPPSYATILGGGLIHWSRSDDTIGFRLYGSPDAGHYVRLAVEPQRLVGRGTSWGAGAAYVDWPDDVVVAQRIAPSDPSVCHAAGGAVLEDFRRAVRGLRDSLRPLQN
jgi:hypothetical protein